MLKRVVLVVDDDSAIVALVDRTLAQIGLIPLPVASAEEALRIVDRLSTRVGLVLTDVTLPGMTGLELAAELEKADPPIPVVLVSGWLTSNSGEDVRGGNIVAQLAKPFTLSKLRECVREVLESQARE